MGYDMPVSNIDERSDWGQALRKIQVFPDSRMMGGTYSVELARRALETAVVVKDHNLPVRLVGYSPTFSETRLYPGQKTDWVVMPLHQDPQIRAGRPIYMPPHALNDLKRIRKSGLNFESIYIAHEVHKGTIDPTKPVTLEMIAPPTPQSVQIRAQEIADWSMNVHRVGMSVFTAGVGVLAALLAAPAAMMAPTTGLDPILFGLHIDRNVTVNDRPLATWYYLTHWIDG
jgi:hypothetical protein